MPAFTKKTWVNGIGQANARLNDDSLNDLEERIETAIALPLKSEETGAGHGPLVTQVGLPTFSDTEDPVLYLGYNYDEDGLPVEAGEPRVGFVVEADYDDGSKQTMEAYVEHHNEAGTLQARPFFSQVKRDATTAATFQTATVVQGPIITFLGESADPATAPERFVFADGVMEVYGSATNPSGHVSIQSIAGGNGRLSLSYTTTEAVITYGAESTTIGNVFMGARPILRYYAAPNGAPGSAISVGNVVDNSAVGLFDVADSNAAVKGVVARGSASQSGSLFEVQNSGGTYLSKFNKDGYFMTKKTSAPADGDLAAGELAIWFDPTNGAAKVKFKAKETGGTVRTGEVALA